MRGTHEMMVQSVNHRRNQIALLWLSQAQDCLSLEQEMLFSLAYTVRLGYGYSLSALAGLRPP